MTAQPATPTNLKALAKAVLLWSLTAIGVFLSIRLLIVVLRFVQTVTGWLFAGELVDRISMISPMSLASSVAIFVLVWTLSALAKRTNQG